MFDKLEKDKLRKLRDIFKNVYGFFRHDEVDSASKSTRGVQAATGSI